MMISRSKTFAFALYLLFFASFGGLRAGEIVGGAMPGPDASSAGSEKGQLQLEQASPKRVAMAEKLVALLEKGDTGIVLAEPFRVGGLAGALGEAEAKHVWDCLDGQHEAYPIEASDIRAFKSDFMSGLGDSALDQEEIQAAKRLLASLLGDVSGGLVMGGTPVFRVFRTVSYDSNPAKLIFGKTLDYLVVDILSGRGLTVCITRNVTGGLTIK